MTIALIIISILLAAAVIAAVWLLAERRGLRAERDRLHVDLTEHQTQLDATRAEFHDLEKQLVAAAEQQKSAEQMLDQLRKQLPDVFRSTANQALSESNKQFLDLAAARFKQEQTAAGKDLDARRQSIEAMVKPVREALDKTQHTMQQIETSRKEAYGSLSQQVAAMSVGQQELKQETANLVRALRRPEVRGRWGEMQLRRVVELAGMIEHCDFDEQQTVHDEEGGRLRPDMVVRLPADRTIVIDAKTPLDAYLDSIESDDDALRQEHLARHADQIETQISALSGKDYTGQFARAPDFVVLFIPGEPFLQAAVQMRPDLMEAALRRNVVVATPSTLISLLRVVALGWREEQLAENARRISDEGQRLHERIATIAGHLQKLGGSISSAVDHYNSFVGSFETRVASSARKLEELHAKSSKQVPEIIVLEKQPRPLRTTTTDDPTPDVPHAAEPSKPPDESAHA